MTTDRNWSTLNWSDLWEGPPSDLVMQNYTTNISGKSVISFPFCYISIFQILTPQCAANTRYNLGPLLNIRASQLKVQV